MRLYEFGIDFWIFNSSKLIFCLYIFKKMILVRSISSNCNPYSCRSTRTLIYEIYKFINKKNNLQYDESVLEVRNKWFYNSLALEFRRRFFSKGNKSFGIHVCSHFSILIFFLLLSTNYVYFFFLKIELKKKTKL